MFVWTDVETQLEAELVAKSKSFGTGKTLVFSMLTDGFSPTLVAQDVTERVLSILLERTSFRIRILTKNAVVGSPKWSRFTTNDMLAELLRARDERLKSDDGEKMIKLRRQTVEPVHAQLRQHGLARLHVRGLARGAAILSLAALGHNLMKWKAREDTRTLALAA